MSSSALHTEAVRPCWRLSSSTNCPSSRLTDVLMPRSLPRSSRLSKRDSRSIDYVGHMRGVIALLMPATTARGAHARLERLAHLLASSNVSVAGKRMSMTPIIGYASLERGLAQESLEERAWIAMLHQAQQLDLHPSAWSRSMSPTSPRGSFLYPGCVGR